ncbi:unnamed protein product [Adineta steineri]|uniref:Uncharacterized protein n=1 Tax=Adineta steineri TaxID=433720 RepID=A0A819S1S7_9BILA|nr:unnamed protein product [Adineta steineri]CAF4062628.1 unnamed protein product [Adineta steineri]
MSLNPWNRNTNGTESRPGSGQNRSTSYRGGHSGAGRPYNSHSTCNYNNQESRERNSASTNNGRWRRRDDFSTHQSKPTDDETRAYAVNLLLSPVELGITTTIGQAQREFKGLGAFNHYFGLLAPTNSFGYTLPDIWDGYFHITLAKFTTSSLTPKDLEAKFLKFVNPVKDLPNIPDIVFRASKLTICPGANRARGRANIDFIVLPVDVSTEIKTFYEKIQPLLIEIKKQTESKGNEWSLTELKDLHVTIRKYSNIDRDIDRRQQIIDQIPIQQYPLEFRCQHLEIKQAREQAINQYKQTPNYRWWNGATETADRKCSDCHTPVSSINWEGFCLACGKYETIIPLWSTSGNTSNLHNIQQGDIQNNILSKLGDVSINDQ